VPVYPVSDPVYIDRVYLAQAVDKIKLLFPEYVPDFALEGQKSQWREPFDGLYQVRFGTFQGSVHMTRKNMHIVSGF
jgi:hypothetical protein